MHILLVSIFFKKTYGDIFLNVFIKFEGQRVFSNHSYFHNYHGQQKLCRKVGEISEYVQIISSFLVLGYLIGCDILVTLWNMREFAEFDSCFIAPKFYFTTLHLLDTWKREVFLSIMAQCLLKVLELTQSP